ncbi:MAG TPA: ribosome biogenesis GTP-binding protein YihA/YsxC [Pseudomonadota bacterium]|nr:ribosome biogenesis GTP-binding protein YihA/YsxC [Pseudomonadota bacterium]
MHIVHADFLQSAASAAQWPQLGLPEVALCGRSNVGKSTLLNTLLGRKGLARVSRTPGRTQLLNFFTVTVSGPATGARQQLVLADLPGFGYAQVSRSELAKWRPMMEQYLTERTTLRAVVLLCDGRRAAERDAADLLFEELELGRFLREYDRAVIPVLTKADKLSKHERKPTALALQRLFGQRVTVVSGQTGEGTGELWRRLRHGLGPAARPPETTADDSASPRLPAADQGVTT